jgi:hypothetical protein
MRRLPSFTSPIAAIVAVLLSASASDALAAQSRASGQAIRGTVSEEGTLQPVAGAFVALLDASGARVAGGLSRDDGAFLVSVPEPGSYRLRAERIGFRSTESVQVEVAAGEIVSLDIVAPAQAIVIRGVDVEGGRRCDLRPDQGRETLALWEEARKALDVALWTDDDGRFVYELRSWTRRFDRSGRRLLSERIDRRTHVGRHAFRAVSPESLARDGFVQGNNAEGRFYYAPDAGVLMSNAFLGTHCFEAVEVDDRLGLRFSPVPGRDLTEVEGMLWFAEGTSRLERLEYQYVNVTEAVDERFGGEVVFEELPGGEWIVREWEIRMPILTNVVSLSGAPRLVVDAVEAAGGEVVEVREAEQLLPLGTPGLENGRVRGSVVDSTTGRMLEDASVFVSGTNRVTRTDGDGAFELGELTAGLYTLLIDHPRLAELGIMSPAVPVEVQPRAETRVTFYLPSIRGLVGSACRSMGSEPPSDGSAALAGVVRTGGVAPTDLTVVVRWTEVSASPSSGLPRTRGRIATIQPDALGRWGACALPAGRSVSVLVERGDEEGAVTDVGPLRPGEARWLIVDAPGGRR